MVWAIAGTGVRKIIRFTIRAKLLLLSVVILGIPYIGLEYIRELEKHLRDALEVSLVDAARAEAGLLHGRGELFEKHEDDPETSLYVHELLHPIQVDGYVNDWNAYLSWSGVYQDNSDSDTGVDFKLIIGQYELNYYILIQVTDRNLVFSDVNKVNEKLHDQVKLVMQDRRGSLRTYYFSPTAPGVIRPYTFNSRFNEFGDESSVIEYATNIKGEWQKSANGYNLEIVLPVNLIGEYLGFIVRNSDGSQHYSLGTAGIHTESAPGRLMRSSAKISEIISSSTGFEGRRTWVLNHQGQVLSSSGSLDKSHSNMKQNLFYSLILPAVPSRVTDDLAGKSRLQGEEVTEALDGRTRTQWRNSPDAETVIVSAATPVWIDGEVSGVVVVEESSSGIQMLQRNAMVSLFNRTMIIFAIVTTLLLGFATRLSARIKRLSENADAAIDEHGRVSGEFLPDSAGDEIGDLSRNYAAILGRLGEYNHYLENLAGRLSHELRTPMAVVQSSLEHLQSQPDNGQKSQTYLDRAQQGMERLGLILTRLGEASRLEQAMQSAEMEETDVLQLLRNCVEGYGLAYPGQQFQLQTDIEAFTCNLPPDLFVQMLDKLVSNAVDFSQARTPVAIGVSNNVATWQVSVSNIGPTLPAGMEDQLFNSMISLRDGSADDGPHLGLGLFIVRLIAEYLGGSVRADNLADGSGVCFQVRFRKT